MPVYDGKYVTTEEIRQEGVTEDQASDDAIAKAIKGAEVLIDGAAGRWFWKRVGITMTLDAGTKYYLFAGISEAKELLTLPVPIISLTAITIDGIAKMMTDFIVYSRIGPPKDDRWNPRIISKNQEWPVEGLQNIVLTGDFGFVDDIAGTYGVTPPLISIAARKWAIRLLPIHQMAGGSSTMRDMGLKQGLIIEETIPGYSYRLTTKTRQRITDWSGDPEIDDIIDFYRYSKFISAV